MLVLWHFITVKAVVTEVTYNPEQDVSAYWIRITADNLDDSGDLWHTGLDAVSGGGANLGRANGPTYKRHHELQAVVYPKNGPPRILHGKPNNSFDNILYNEIPSHTRSDGIRYGSKENGIRSFYFSSNRNNTLFNGSVYVDAVNGVDDLSRSGTEQEPMYSIEFAFRKLMRMKFKHYNPSSNLDLQLITEGDVGGGKIYLMDLGDGPASFAGHKMGYKNLADQTAPSTVTIKNGKYDTGFPFKCFAHRWVTISPAPGVTDKKRAKIKGFHPQQNIAFYKQAANFGIVCTLVKYENLYMESDYPYTEYLFGIGPVLDQNETTSQLQYTDKWRVKRGVASDPPNPTTEDPSDQLCCMWGFRHTSLATFAPVNAVSNISIRENVKFIMPPRAWFHEVDVDADTRTPERIYKWADAYGLTYTTTMITPFNHNTLTAADLKANTKGFTWQNAHIGIQHKDGTLAFGGTYGNGSSPGNPLQLDKVPSIFVKTLTPMAGFCADAGYTFNFSWVNPVGSHTNAQFDTAATSYIFMTNSVIRKSQEPGQCRFDMCINSTIDQTQGDIFLGNGVLYQPFIINGYAMSNTVNAGSAVFGRPHSDILQSNGGEFSFLAREVGMNNVIMYRLNNPSPRSPRYDNPEKRHFVPGTGKVTNPNRQGQALFSGQVKEGKVFYEGVTYTYTGTPYNKDIVLCDSLIKTRDASQQWILSCRHENILAYNTQMMSSNPDTPIPNNTMIGMAGGPNGAVRRYQDAVPSYPFLHRPNSNTAGFKIHSSFDLFLLDNVQTYKVDPNFEDEQNQTFNQPREKLQLWVSANQTANSSGIANTTKVGIDLRQTIDNKPLPPIDEDVVISNLEYPFELNGKVGNDQAKIFFPVVDLDKDAYLLEPIIDGSRPQPTATIRGTWWTNTLPSTVNGAPYGWWPSAVTYENFRNGDNGDGAAGDIRVYWNTEKLGTGGDPTLGTGKSNPQPTDPGYNPNQRGFRNTILYRYTNFDYDGTRDDNGVVRQRSEFEGDSTQVDTQQGNPPTPLQNHPITIRLTTTDIKQNMSWTMKDNIDPSAGTTHGPDGIYPSADIIQIPNYLDRIEEITDPNNSPEIGPSVNSEIIGNTFAYINQGGVYVSGGVVDNIQLNTNFGDTNKIVITNLATTFLNKARKNNGMTMCLIIHGKSNPSSEFGEFKYLAAPPEEIDPDTGLPRQGDFDFDEVFYENFYKKFAYIAFNSKESPVTQSITSNQFSFRKSAHHTYINFSRPEMDGLSLSSALNGTSIIDMVTPFVSTPKLAKLQTATIGCTCNFNSYGTENTSASRVAGTSPTTITCKSISLEYLGFDGNQIRFKNKAASSMFSSRTPAYQHSGAIGSANQTFQFNSSINDYRFDIPLNEPDVPPTPEQSINIRFLNPVGSGSKNLLGYKVPAAGVRLFGGTNNIGITAGSYIRVSNSPSNNGIYQVLSVIDGIDGDTLSNTATNGSTEYQYLELSRSITAQEQAVGNSIVIENVSHLPILHVKYRQPL